MTIRRNHPNSLHSTKSQLMLFSVARLVLLFYAGTHLAALS